MPALSFTVSNISRMNHRFGSGIYARSLLQCLNLPRMKLAEELDAIRTGADQLRLSFEHAMKCLGDRTDDIYLNGTAYWKSVPERVWSTRSAAIR